MESSQSEPLLKIPGSNLFHSSFSLKTSVPDPFPGPILMIPPSDPKRLHRPRLTGLDLSHVSPLYIPKNMHIPLGDLYKMFELQPRHKKTDSAEQALGEKRKWSETEIEKNNKGLFEDLPWTKENDLILTHSGKKTLTRDMSFQKDELDTSGDAIKAENGSGVEGKSAREILSRQSRQQVESGITSSGRTRRRGRPTWTPRAGPTCSTPTK